MVEYLYEKDLKGMQYNILISARHAALVSELAARYGMRRQELIKRMIDRMDMILLENLPARYEAGLEMGDADDEIARELGCELVSRYVPLVDKERMVTVIADVRTEIQNGTKREIALQQAQEKIRELIRS
jgi:energy-converting hydrogenase A subunit M